MTVRHFVTRAAALLALASACFPSVYAQAYRPGRVDPDDCLKHATVVIVGASTASGAGAVPRSESWANRFEAMLRDISPANRVVNLAVGGYSTYEHLPTSSAPVAGRPKPDPRHNITFALSLRPTAIIFSVATNDIARGFSVEEVEANVRTIMDAARDAGVPIWVTTPTPRALTDERRAQLAQLRDFLMATYRDRAIDFWAGTIRPDRTMLPAYDSGDHIHPGTPGHAILYYRVAAARILEQACSQNPHPPAR